MNGCFTASGWTPEGRRARGDQKPLGEGERNKVGRKSWNLAKAAGLSGQCDGLMRLLAQRAMIVIKKSRGSFGE